MGVTPSLAPILGGQVLIFGSWRGIFAIMAACGTMLLVAVVLTMRETLNPEKVIPLGMAIIAKNYLAMLHHRRFICYTLAGGFGRSEEHTSELQSLMRSSYAVFCLKKKTQ